MDRTACTDPQCLYNGALYLYLYLYSPYGPYSLYRATLPAQLCTFLYLVFSNIFRETRDFHMSVGVKNGIGIEG